MSMKKTLLCLSVTTLLSTLAPVVASDLREENEKKPVSTPAPSQQKTLVTLNEYEGLHGNEARKKLERILFWAYEKSPLLPYEEILARYGIKLEISTTQTSSCYVGYGGCYQ